MIASRGPDRGFTYLEVAVGTAILLVAILTMTSFLSASHAVAADTRAAIRATAELRRNLEAITNVVRGIDIDTLDGFDPYWQSENPTFRRVLGASLEARVHDEFEELRWIASTFEVDGVAEPGAVFLVTNGGQRLLADRVPRGGFRLRQDGNTLAVHLTTYYATGERRTKLVTGSTAIRMRN